MAKRKEAVEEGRKLCDDIEKLEKDRQKVGYKLERLKEKTSGIIDKENIELAEFEYIATVKEEDGEVIAEIFDKLEDYKKALREKK